MSNDSNIKSFTAIDIEKYHKGQLSAKEMHAMEKAALDDPFLADALEGYATTTINVAADIAELKKRLAERTKEEDKKVIPIATQKAFPWMRAAAVVVLIAGAGLLTYFFGFNNNVSNSPISQVEKKEVKSAPVTNNVADTAFANVTTNNNQYKADTQASLFLDTSKMNWKTQQGFVSAEVGDANSDRKEINFNKAQKKADADGIVDQFTKPSVPANGNAGEKLNKDLLDESKAFDDKRALALKENAPGAPKKLETSGSIQTDTVAQKGMMNDQIAIRGTNRSKNVASDNESRAFLNQAKANVFRGQVKDADNNVVPFANITNTADNVGTYTDAKGNFTLTSPDSILNVQVRSLGYENNNIQLRRQLSNNQVIMKEDRSSLNEVVVSNKKVNSVRSRTSTMVLDEPEPIDGWTNYDAYLANNLNIPETFKTKQAPGGEVQLSFEVNKKGEPVNITVDKSLCESCDKEAIRLVKDGPKWKRKSRKSRTTVTVAF